MAEGKLLSSNENMSSNPAVNKLGQCNSEGDGRKRPRPSSASAAAEKPSKKKPEADCITPLPKHLVKWQKEKIQSASSRWKLHTTNVLTDGYTIIKGVLPSSFVRKVLEGQQEQTTSTKRASTRKRKGNQQWQGAIRTIHAHIKSFGGTETVTCPLTTRAPGRYDLPLPPSVLEEFLQLLEACGIADLLKFLCPRGKFRTHDILLSKSGSKRQEVHTDSWWTGNTKRNPSTKYLTVLIPMTVQDKATGGTRVWPGTHRLRDAFVGDSNYVDCIEPLLKVGDALIFDGLLSHCGMENLSGIVDSAPRDRYFYYAAFSSIHDPNTEVTGT